MIFIAYLQEKNENCFEQGSGNCSVGSECKTNIHKGGCDNDTDVKDQDSFDSDVKDHNKDVSVYLILC